MNEEKFARQMLAVLDRGNADLPAPVAERLHAARRQALEHQRQEVRLLSVAGVGRGLTDFVLTHRGPVATAFLLLALILGSELWQDGGRAQELEETDSALLSDDLPIDAYLDGDFARWLKHDPADDSSR